MIRPVLKGIAAAKFMDASRELLAVLGYHSERTLDGQTGRVADFITHPNTATEHTFTQQATSAQLIFQVTNDEIQDAAQAQGRLLDATTFDHQGLAQSFLFMAVDLKGKHYPRGQYANFTRAINKRFPAPAVVLFKTADDLLTLAFVHRRAHKHHPDRDMLGSVSLVREIDPTNPHRAHLDILHDLSLAERLRWMNANGQPYNFDGLLAAWLDALDTEELNRQFYSRLFAWFSRATREATFPTKEAKTLPPEEHIIRLITRLLFVWFIKEKGLIAEELFVEANVNPLLHGYDPVNGDSYYRAILQNLFFATLNTEINRRGFSKASNTTHRDPSRYRYANEIADTDNLLKLFARTPFINGGLFDCLDSYEASNQGGYRIDCFSDNPNQRKDYSIPNRLFFDDNGLLPLFNRYKFTVEENTPTEQEVALDPELLGKVFENLLAAYNPETASTARKQTGSYYTPRPVVDFMVDEALTAAIATHYQPMDGDMEFWQARLRGLLDYADAFNDADELFEERERLGIVRAIAHLTVLDPAVGSGAFPMGVLHKLTLALRRLDQDNKRWEHVQKDLAMQRADLAFDTQDQQERKEELADISDTFERYRESDFGRKLYLIQNSIFGVDIQTIATQIAKLRFFISLAIEQDPDPDADNYGIKPLPNLETRFVAANTLLTLAPSPQMSLGHTARVTQLQSELNTNRERYFHATTRHKKLACKEKDKQLRDDLAAELKKIDMPAADADKIAHWDPYDQNASADWFHPTYMFGVREGFDVVIGNPPYKQVRKGVHAASYFPYAEGKDRGKQNLYKLFVEQSYNLCKKHGLATLIVQSSLLCDLSSAATRQLLLDHTQLKHIIEFPERARTRAAQVFTSVTQGTCIYQFTKALPNDEPIQISVGNDAHSIAQLRFAAITKNAILALYPELRCLPHIRAGSVSILEKIAADKSIKPLGQYAASIVQGDLNLTTHSARFSRSPSPVRLLRGRHVTRFLVRYDDATEYCEEGFMTDRVNANRHDIFLISQQVMNALAPRRLNFVLTENPPTKLLWGNSVNKLLLKNQVDSRTFLALLNSKFMDWFFRITSTNNHVQGYELRQLPIPAMSDEDRKELDNLATQILAAKDADPSADTNELEAQIDRLVYAIYGLTAEEIALLEG